MKTLKALLVLAFVGLAGTASAQFANSGSSASGSSIWTTVNTDGYNRVYVSYLPSTLKVDGLDGDDLGDLDDIRKLKGSFEIGYLRGIGLTQKVPLYLEVGGALQYRHSKADIEGLDFKVNMFSLNIPVSLAYRININDDFAIAPNFGFDFRINMTGKLKAEYDGKELIDMNLFKDETIEDEDLGSYKTEAWKRFQAGWHIGVGFDYKALHFGVNYGTDFNEITEDCKIATTSVRFGYNF